MPIKIPNLLPATTVLQSENIFVMTETRAMTQDIRPLRIALLNLMPNKIQTETQLARLLGNTPLQIELELIHTKTHRSKNTSEEHLLSFYKTFDDVKHENFDGLIITGAPVEQMPFEDVRYWKQLLDIYSWMQVHVNAILHICWGAQAALYGLFGIPKYDLREKMFGIFEQKIEISSLPIFKGFSNAFFMPHSRHTEIRRSDISSCKALEIVASSPVAGVSVVQTKDERQLFVTGHLEYMPGRLAFEYRRDLKKHLPIHIPYNYFENDDPNGAIIDSWRNDARRFYKNWLENYVNNHSLSHVKP